MAAVTQSYSTQAYTGVQRSHPFFGGDKSVSSINSTSSNSQNTDSLTLSAEGQELSRNSSTMPVTEEKENLTDTEGQQADEKNLSEEQVRQISELKRRDSEVKAHEQAHLAAAGQYAAGGASFSYQTGPDGKRYATGGEVPIDIGKESSPEATIQKMRTVKRAALAPASPSSADRSIAAQVTSIEAQAMSELLSNVRVKSAQEPLSKTDKGDDSRETETSARAPVNVQNDSPSTSPFSELTRRTMNAAYQTMADMAT
ncbi:MAG: catalase [Proteobacteria bacterium]|nr:catalase [Pseudomonadota bacterium]MBU1234648.1 catalase [Pseudomonadota bacterium]MBU1418721.1 catalase [Pseudomonadota bacterium]MBU1454467.1 catalase [Pseudomonadota bacterium]